MKNSNPAGRRGFTLVEMLAVVAIIVILAALVVGGMKYATEKTNTNKAKIQVALLSSAIEQYKIDTGSYPASQNPTGENESANLRKLLFLDGKDDTNKVKKIYLTELEETSKQGWITGTGDTAKITDPWGNEYRYRSGKAAANQDFDVWSVGKDGKTKEDEPKAKESIDDIRNSN
ncbi:type II secretion system protein GspG [Luteolibacter ambystomatis]|uniref:Type II secretion system protein GspG n=1 Tax=Luteolibacter ambystomatis TaxID=2824561 RepID=A0A975G6P5_9BACT|nr:type II secretion system protein GspG [Luteolibacter ambystomatis]QUE49790.1 type II secretion system protein GspG [Luteolibacter ambystomatis]